MPVPLKPFWIIVPCISYQTIENKGEISQELSGKLANRVFGCDICQDVCPWNRNALNHLQPEFEPKPGLMGLTSEQWHNLERENYTRLFKLSPVKRAGFEKLKGSLSFLQK